MRSLQIKTNFENRCRHDKTTSADYSWKPLTKFSSHFLIFFIMPNVWLPDRSYHYRNDNYINRCFDMKKFISYWHKLFHRTPYWIIRQLNNSCQYTLIFLILEQTPGVCAKRELHVHRLQSRWAIHLCNWFVAWLSVSVVMNVCMIPVFPLVCFSIFFKHCLIPRKLCSRKHISIFRIRTGNCKYIA